MCHLLTESVKPQLVHTDCPLLTGDSQDNILLRQFGPELKCQEAAAVWVPKF